MTTDMSQLRRSMLEMYELSDLNSSGDAMDDISVKTSASPPPEEARDDDNSPLRVGNRSRPIQVTIGGSSTMRRSMSMASLPSEAERQKKSFSLLAMVPDIHTSIAAIKEEEDEENMGECGCSSPSPSPIPIGHDLSWLSAMEYASIVSNSEYSAFVHHICVPA
jgi:hypothetical protein